MVKNKTLVIHQPSFLPWIGFFDLLDLADIYIIYDDVAFDKNGWRNRNKIKTSSGTKWLTIPVKTSGRFGQLNKDVIIDNVQHWKKKHKDSVFFSYKKASQFQEVYNLIEPIWNLKSEFLLDYQIFALRLIIDFLKIDIEIILASELLIRHETDDRQERLINLCLEKEANTLLNGSAGELLYSTTDFAENEISLKFQDYQHPKYAQLHGPFVPYMSIIDLLFCEGNKSLALIQKGRNFK